MRADKFIFVLLTMILLYVFSQAIARSPGIIEGFETGEISKIWTEEFAENNYAARVVNSIARAGNYALRIELRKNDPDITGSRRAEIALPSEDPLEEHWYAFSIFLPSGGKEDYAIDHDSAEIIAQWHNNPDEGEEWTSPPLAFSTANGRYYLSRRWDDALITSNERMIAAGKTELLDLGSYQGDKGKWVDWKFHIKWGWLKSQKPLLEVFKNNRRIAEFNGLPNTTHDKMGVYLKLGIFKWDWKEDPDASRLGTRIIYYDEISVDDPRVLKNIPYPPDVSKFTERLVFPAHTGRNKSSRVIASQTAKKINSGDCLGSDGHHALATAAGR